MKLKLAIAALAVFGGVLGIVALSGLDENLVYYWNVEELLAKRDATLGATIRLGGLVQRGSVQWLPETLDLTFRVVSKDDPDPTTATVLVKSTGTPPQMFREGMGVVVEGKFDGTQFHSDRLMVKHSNEYRPPKAGERPQELYKTLVDES